MPQLPPASLGNQGSNVGMTMRGLEINFTGDKGGDGAGGVGRHTSEAGPRPDPEGRGGWSLRLEREKGFPGPNVTISRAQKGRPCVTQTRASASSSPSGILPGTAGRSTRPLRLGGALGPRPCVRGSRDLGRLGRGAQLRPPPTPENREGRHVSALGANTSHPSVWRGCVERARRKQPAAHLREGISTSKGKGGSAPEAQKGRVGR